MSTQTPDAITAILHAKAAAELEKEIDAAFEPARRISDNCCSIHINVRVPGEPGKTSTITGKCHYHELIGAMKKAAFDFHLPNRQKEAVKEFLNRVDKLQSELDELRESVQ